MKTGMIVVGAALLAMILLADQTGRLSAAQEPTPSLYALLITTGPGWDTTRSAQQQRFFTEHSRNLRRLRDAGILVTGGRFGAYGLMIVQAPSPDSARALLAPDSSIAAGTFNVSVSRWSTVYDGTLKR
jgi:uncharacterized protein YciI